MQEQSLYYLFFEVLDRAGVEILFIPSRFNSCLMDCSKGKIRNQKLLYAILEKYVLPEFSNLNHWSAASIDALSENVSVKIQRAYPISEDWAKEIVYSLGAAVKRIKNIPVDENNIIPVSIKQNLEEKTGNNGFLSPDPHSKQDGKRKKSAKVTAALLIIVFLASVGLLLTFRDKHQPSDDLVLADALSNDHYEYKDIIAQYQRMAYIGYNYEAFQSKLESEYVNYCYIADGPFFFTAKGGNNSIVGYSIMDINSDDVDELIITNDDQEIFDIFTMDQQGRAVSLFGSFSDSDGNQFDEPKEGCSYYTGLGYQKQITLLKDGNIGYLYTDHCVMTYNLPANGIKLKTIYGVCEENGHYYQLLYDGSEKEISVEDFRIRYNDEVNLFNQADKTIDPNPTILTA